jgi:hypothetical protein
MNTILENIESIDSFDELANQLQSKDLIKQVHDFLYGPLGTTGAKDYHHASKKQKTSRILNVRTCRLFLTAYMICRFPREILGTIGQCGEEGLEIEMNDQDNAIQQKATELIDYAKTIDSSIEQARVRSVLVQLLNSFTTLFNMWKIIDREKLKDALIAEYHQLSVNIMNEQACLSEDPSESASEHPRLDNQTTHERIQTMEECKESLLETARILGGDNLVEEVGQYSPVVIDLDELCKQYGNAFWDMLGEEYRHKVYDKIFVVLENILKSFEILYEDGSNDARQQKLTDVKEKLDIDFIRQRINHEAYSEEEMHGLCKFILSHAKTLIAAQFDDNMRILEQSLLIENFLPIFLREISMILQITVTDTNVMRKTMQQADSAAS